MKQIYNLELAAVEQAGMITQPYTFAEMQTNI